MPVPLSNHQRRRAGASRASQVSRSPIPWRRNSTASWPITIGFALKMPAGSRRTAYMNAPRSGSLVLASGCRLEFIAACEGSSTRRRVSPEERSSVVYVRW